MPPEIVRRLVGGIWRTVEVDANGGGGSLPSGGTTGEVLAKQSNADGDVGWDPSGGSSPITSPLGLTGCQLWLDASQLALANNANVTTWPDLSGNGYNATQDGANGVPVCKTAVLNGLRIVRFASSGPQYLKLTGAALGLFRNLSGVTVAGVSAKASGNDYLFEASSGTDITQLRVQFETGNNFSISDDDTQTGVASASVLPFGVALATGQFCAALFAVNFAAGHIGVAADAASAGAGGYGAKYAPNAAATPNTDSLAIYLGQGTPGSGVDAFDGDCGELIVYNRTLNASERRQIIEYLSAKWATL